jgi:hypothetical protein
MAKYKIHIGKLIKDELDKSPISVVDFAKSINLTRNGAYKVFDKETIDTGQLQTISKVLNHNFFSYYEDLILKAAKENKIENKIFVKSEFTELSVAITKLAKAIDRIDETLNKKKSIPPQ